MKNPFTIVIPLFCLVGGLVSGEPSVPVADKPESNSQWREKSGKKVSGRFISLSGDRLIIVKDGREITISLSLLEDESARQARKLAGISEPLAPIPVARPLPMEFLPIKAVRLEAAKPFNMSRSRKKISDTSFTMGSPTDEFGRESREPLHKVNFKRDFMLKATEVTWNEWESVRNLARTGYSDLSPGTNGQGGTKDGLHPVLGITWWDAIKWCNLLSQLEGLTPVYYTNPSLDINFILKSGTPTPYVDWSANGYRLPTEAEWEFACRSDTSTQAFHTGPIRKIGSYQKNLTNAGWFLDNSDAHTHPVKMKTPNRFGLYDMHGNAAEWCWDIAGDLSAAEVTDPTGAAAGQFRIVRGGSWQDAAEHCRAAYRGSCIPAAMPNPSIGFRPMRIIPIEKKK